MCGIAGFISLEPDSPRESTLRRMTSVLSHRGPDGDGHFIDGRAALGHRRLSIIDLGGGHQPMFNEDENLAIVYNGEIYNHAGLRPELEKAGHRYRSHCDTETILHAWEQWGESSVERYRGMFAFAIWDRERRSLFCARDRLGIKPFYYFFNGKIFAFASEIKALLEHPAISADFDVENLPEYLTFGYTAGENTLFRGIRKLMPGHTLRISVDRFSPLVRQYWDMPLTPAASDNASEPEKIAELRRRLEETVRLRLMSDVPLGMFLSGGVDSSAIAAIMRRMVDGPVKTFSVGYGERQYSELEYAREVASRIGTDHHEVTVDMEDFFGALPSLVWHEDEPIAWPSSVSLFFVSRLASEHVKVVLTGEGSDELFAGYGRYKYQLWNRKWAERWSFIPASIRRGVRAAIASSPLLRANMRRKLAHTFLGRTPDIPSLFLDNFYGAFTAEAQTGFLGEPSLASRFSPYSNYLSAWEKTSRLPYLERMLYADRKTYLVELLMKQDQMSMAASIESRVPFLDHHLVEWACGVPGSLKLRKNESKYILKKAVEDILPSDIVYRTKMGFPTPLKSWLLDPRADFIYRAIEAPGTLVAEYLDRDAVTALLSRHRNGLEDATDRIWNLYNLQTWGNIFLRGEPVEPVAELGVAGRPV
jgi:asparagine synthase (glutamine-hydrolysing)